VWFAYPLDLKTRVDPHVTIPADSSSKDTYSIGGGVTANVDLSIFNLLGIGPEFGIYFNPFLNTGTFAQIITCGIGANMYLYPVSRLNIEIGGSGGIFSLTYNDYSVSNLWWKVYGTAGVRLSPTFSISANAGYINFNGYSKPLYTGFFAGISGTISIDTKGSKGNIDVDLNQQFPIFPLFYSLYKNNSIGTLTITNNETAEIRNVKVSFKAITTGSSLIISGGSFITSSLAALTIFVSIDGFLSFTSLEG
jgi:hypothetical protein